MKKQFIALILSLALLLSFCPQAFAQTDSFYPDFTVNYADVSSAQSRAREWFDSLSVPFSFKLDGTKSEKFIDSWSRNVSEETGEDGHLYRTITFTNPENTLELRVEAVLYQDVPTVEWVVRAQNIDDKKSETIRDLMGLDVVFPGSETSLLTTRGALGQYLGDAQEDFFPVRHTLSAGDSQSFSPQMGRSTNGAWPYYNLRFDSQDGGVMLAIGWSGQWMAEFEQEKDGLYVRSGMQTLNTWLYPDEEIRTPSYSVTFYDGSEIDGQNMLRRVMLSHYTPVNEETEEKLVAPFSINFWGGRTEEWITTKTNDFVGAGVLIDTIWMDAGWFGDHPADTPVVGMDEWFQWTGDWTKNPNLFPNSLSAIGEYADQENLRFLLWLEPERCDLDSAFYQEHKDWCYSGSVAGSTIVNFGNPDALSWWIDYGIRMIDEWGVDILRQDFNIEPGSFWPQNDIKGRHGINEIRHIEGLYAFWDALLAHNPALIIDNCASGGRRLDFEALKRSIPLWASDYYCDPYPASNPEGAQSHRLSLATWLPIFGTGFGSGTAPANPYVFRSHMAPAMSIPDDGAFKMEAMVAQAYQARPLMYGDFYPLTEPSPHDNTVWQAWEYFRPDLQEGLLTVFRRKTPENKATFTLSGLDPEASYAFDDADSKYDTPAVYTGKQLMEEGLTITLGTEKSAMYFFSQVD